MNQHAKKISLTMIVKDEENCIGRCLNSVKDLVDEIVIVDTGSTDKTLDICRSFQAKVYSYHWNNHFADARNFGLDKVTGDWVLWLDADEQAAPVNAEEIRSSSLLDDYDVLSVPLINFYGDSADLDQVVQIAQPRLFKREKNFRFENRIHEWLNITEAFQQKRVGFIDLKIYHYGYMNKRMEEKQKHGRNLNLLLQELEENRTNAWTHYYLATEYYRNLEYEHAFRHVNASIYLFLNQGMIPPPSMLYSLKYSILIDTGSWDGAWPGIKSAVKMFPDYVDLKYYMGVILYHKKMIPEALTCFEACIEMGEENLKHLTSKGAGGYRAWYFKGLCLEDQGKYEEALAAYRESIQCSNRFLPAIEALQKLEDRMNHEKAGLM